MKYEKWKYVIMIEVKLCHCILYIFSLYLRFNFNLTSI